MTITKYNPFDGFLGFPTGLRFFENSLDRLLSEPVTHRSWAPPVDIIETDNNLVLKSDLPDVDLKDIDIQIEDGTLTLKGERKFEKEDKSAGYHRMERSYGSFVRCFSLPDTVESDKVKADYRNGVLTVTLPKTEAAKPRTVKVEVSKN
jgi:HSP20 family protein